MTAVTSGFAAGHHAVSLLKGITQVIRASGKSEVLNDFIELQMAMLEILAKQQELTLQNADLQARIKELESEAALTRELKFDGVVYWRFKLNSENPGVKEGPFCQTCFDRDHKLVYLQAAKSTSVKWYCNVCKFQVWEEHSSPERMRRPRNLSGF